MSEKRFGKPVKMTNGDRRILVEILEGVVEELNQNIQNEPILSGQRLWKLRRRQLRRIILELKLAREEAPEKE
jgi:hypothetical protein